MSDLDLENNEEYQKLKANFEHAKKSFTKEEARKMSKKMTEVSEKFMEAELFSPNTVYVDLALMKDLHLGTLFAMIRHRKTAQEDYEYIQKNLKSYQIRLYDDPIRYFPKLNITQEEFDAFKADEKNHDEIFILAPPTMYNYVLLENLKVNVKNSKIKLNYEKIPIPGTDKFIADFADIFFFINTYPLKLSDAKKDVLRHLVSGNFHVGVYIFEDHPKDISRSIFSEMEDINIYRLDYFLLNEGVNKDLSDEKYIGKFLAVPLLADPRSEGSLKDDDAVRKSKLVISSRMGFFCNFKWLEAAKYCSDITCFDDGDKRTLEELLESDPPEF